MIHIKWDDMQVAVFCAALVSFFGDIIIIATYFVSKKWRNELTEMKKIMLVLCTYHICYLLAFVDVNVSNAVFYCRIQASLIQFFGVGTILYEAFVAVECYALCLSVFRGDVVYTPTESERKCFFTTGCGFALNYIHRMLSSRHGRRRHFLYHAFVFCYGVLSVSLMNIYHYYGTSIRLDSMCWIRDPMFNILFGVAPMVVAIVTVFVFNSRVIYLIVTAFGEQATDSTITTSLQGTAGVTTVKEFIHDTISDIRDVVKDVHHNPQDLPGIVAEEALRIPLVKHGAIFVSLFSRLSPRAQNAFLRLIAIPVCFVLIGIPGVVRRVLIFRGYHASHLLDVVTLVSATMGGIMNCIIWVFSDRSVLKDWYVWAHQMWHQVYRHNLRFSTTDCGNCHLQRYSSFSGPESEYSESESDPEEFITRDSNRDSFLLGGTGTVSVDRVDAKGATDTNISPLIANNI